MNLQDVSFAFPQAAYLLLGTFALIWLFFRLFHARQQSLNIFASPTLLRTLQIPRSTVLYTAKGGAICLAWIFATFALMNPQGTGEYPVELTQISKADSKKEMKVKKRMKPHEVILLIDASASMSVKDTRTGTTRLEVAKEIADEIVSRLKGETVSLYAFTSEVSQESPGTIDSLFVRLMIRQILINEGGSEGTNLLKALEFMNKKYTSAEKSPKQKTLILLSDGGDTHIESLQGTERTQAIHNLLSTLNESEKNRMRVFTIGIGSIQGSAIPNMTFEGKPVQSALDEEILRQISQKGHGKYYKASELSRLDLAANLINTMGQNIPTLEEETTLNLAIQDQDNLIKKLYYPIPLTLAILFLIFALILPDTIQRSVYAHSKA